MLSFVVSRVVLDVFVQVPEQAIIFGHLVFCAVCDYRGWHERDAGLWLW